MLLSLITAIPGEEKIEAIDSKLISVAKGQKQKIKKSAKMKAF